MWMSAQASRSGKCTKNPVGLSCLLWREWYSFLFLVSLVSFFSVSQTDLAKPSAYRMPDLACLFLSQLVVKPQLGLALLLVLFHTSLFVSSFFPQIFHQSLSPPRLTALIFHCGDRASFLGSCQCSAGCQYWTTMTRCSSFSLTFLLSFASWKSETDEDMPAKNDLNSVVVSSSELSSVISPGKPGVFVYFTGLNGKFCCVPFTLLGFHSPTLLKGL